VTHASSIASLEQVRTFVAEVVDARMNALGFVPGRGQEIGGVLLRRDYESPREPFLIEFRTEVTDHPSATGLRVRRRSSAPIAGVFVGKLLGVSQSMPDEGSVSPQTLRSRFESDYGLIVRRIQDIRGAFADE